MTALRPGEVEGLVARGPDPRILLVLVYGPDTGLVAERAGQLVAKWGADPDDPFALVRLDGDALAADPGRLVDEAGTLGLFGDTRTVRVRAGSRSIAPAVEALLASGIAGARVVVEAGDLGRSAPLRALCESSPRALALACYPDDARALSDLIERTLREQGLSIAREARDLLARSLGGDRRASLSEIEKLALYTQQGTVSVEHVEAVVSDVAGSVLNAPVDAAFAGRAAEVEREMRRFRHEGIDAATMLGAALRHALALLGAQLGNPGASPSQLVATWRGLHFKRRAVVEAQAARWSPQALRQAVAALQEAVLACRRADPELAHALASAALLRIAGEAGRRRV